MATFRKRGDMWYAEVFVNKTRKGKTFPNKAQARSWANQMEIDLGKLGDHDSRSHTLYDLFKRYAEEVSENKREHFEEWVTDRRRKLRTVPSIVN